MEKEIRVKMTNEKYFEKTGKRGIRDLVIDYLPVDISALSPAARFIAENITATSIIDEYTDHIDVKAIAGFSMEERDKSKGKSDEYIKKMTKSYEEAYTNPIEIDISFPVFGKRHSSAEDVIEEAANQLRKNGAAKLVAKNGRVYAF